MVKHPSNHIAKMGIEIEGAWDEISPSIKEYFKTDSSVKIGDNCACCQYECDCDIHDDCSRGCECSIEHRDDHGCNNEHSWVGELASPPFEDCEKMQIWTDANYPTKVNSSCGIHIHISFLHLLDYSRLMEQKFYDYFEKKMLEFGRLNSLKQDSQFYKRLAGDNSYCLRQYTPDLNSINNGNRYQQLNACWLHHGTIEIRMLPAFQDKKFTVRAIKFIYELFNEFLNTEPLPTYKRFKKLKLKQKIEVEI